MPNLAHECENKWQLTKIFKGQLRVTSTEKGQKMTLKMSTERNKIPLYLIMRVMLTDVSETVINLLSNVSEIKDLNLLHDTT